MIKEFVNATASIPLYQLPAHLASFPKAWPFPRGDLYHWIPALNRFDRIMELLIDEYELDKGYQPFPFDRRLLIKGDADDVQTTPSPAVDDHVLDQLHIPADGDRALVEQIIDFERMLVENCGNRVLYASSERLNKLLKSTSTSLVRTTLRLTLRLAQRYYAARMRLHIGNSTLHHSLLSNHYALDIDVMKDLAAPLSEGPPDRFATPPGGKGKEKESVSRRRGTEKVSSRNINGLFACPHEALIEQYGGASASYYGPPPRSAQETFGHEPPATPTPARHSQPGPAPQTPRPAHPLSNAETPGLPVTPTVSADAENGRGNGPRPVTYSLPASSIASTDIHTILNSVASFLDLSSKYEYFHRIRAAKALHQRRSGLEDVVAIRLLAIANLCWVLTEKEFHSSIGQSDSDEPRRLQLAYQLAELVHPPGDGATGVSRDLQTVALYALEALAKHKSKAPDVCTALSFNVNHGVLFYIVRKAVLELAAENKPDEQDEDWREALFSLLNTLPTSQARTGEGMVSAGLLAILVDVLKLRTPQAERNHPKILQFLDTFVYNLRDAFSALVNAEGLEILADLASYEVDTSKTLAEEGKGMPKEYKTQHTDYQIPFYHQQTLRWLFKFLNHMLAHTGGTSDRIMRNLIDSPKLLNALRTVLLHPGVYGSTVWGMSVHILTSFIHNEPTSYAVISEAGLSESFLRTVSQGPSPPEADADAGSGILPVAEAISSLPPAFGAICLAEAGMKSFKDSPALDRFFDIFVSPTHVKALDADGEMAALVGGSFDELVRHHPPLKASVLTCVSRMVGQVVQLCSKMAAERGIGAKLFTESEDGTIYVAGGRNALGGVASGVGAGTARRHSTAGSDVEMGDVDNGTGEPSDDKVTLAETVETEDSSDGPTVGQYISVACGFLQGFFANQNMCTAYIEADGVESLLDFASLPCLSPDFNNARGVSDEFGRVVQVLVEQKPHLVIPSILKRCQQYLDLLEPLMRHSGQTAFFAPFTTSEPSELARAPSDYDGILQNGTLYVKSLVTVHTLVHALTVTFHGQMFNHRSTQSISSHVNLADMYARLVYSLGRLNRTCVWEEILLQKSMPTEWEKDTRTSGSGLGSTAAEDALRASIDTTPTTERAETSAAEASEAATGTGDREGSAASQNSARFKNTLTLRRLLSKVPTTIAPFFHSLGKLVLYRRSLEPYQKQCAILVADQLAQAAIDQLRFQGPKESSVEQNKYAYWIVALDFISQLIIENPGIDRPTHALTLLLVSFRNLQGLAVLEEIFHQFHMSVRTKSVTPKDKMKEEDRRLVDLALGGIRVILDFYGHIITSKVINESSQTATLQTRSERDKEKADFFMAAQFLVDLRYAVIKPVREVWDSEFMDHATTSIVKTTISILKTVLDGDTEMGAYKTREQVPKLNKPTIKPWKPRNGELLARLQEDGYDESLALEALYRCCDNLNAAREYCQYQTRTARATRNPRPTYETIIGKPPSTTPSRAEIVVPESTQDQGVPEGDTSPESTVANVGSTGGSDNARSSSSTPALQEGSLPVDADWDFLAYRKRIQVGNLVPLVPLDELDEERSLVRKNLDERCLDILNSHDDVTFELADLILSSVTKASDPKAMRADIGSTLVQSLLSLQTDDIGTSGKKIAATAHLLALVIQDKEFYEALIGELKDSFSLLLQFIKITPDQATDQSAPWIGQVLLIIERLLAEDQLPHQIEWTPPTGDEEEEVTTDELPEPVVDLEEKVSLFDAILEILPRIRKNESLALSVTRVLVMLTRNSKISARLAEKRNIQRLFLMVRQLSGITNEALRSAFMIVLRHIIEDETIIRQIMRREIQFAFEQRDRRTTDTTAYTRQMHYLALRDPDIFVEVTNEKLQLARFDSNQRPQALILKREDPQSEAADFQASPDEMADADVEKSKESSEPKRGPTLERTKTSDLKPPVVEKPDGVIHYLLCELLAYKEVEDKPEDSSKVPGSPVKPSTEKAASSAPDGPSSASVTPTEAGKADKNGVEFKAEDHPIYIYRCFLLKCLAELLQSYNRTKVEFINFSRKADPHVSTPSKPRSGVLNYLLNSLVPSGTLEHEGDLSFKKKAVTSSCAIDVIVSLCAKTGELSQNADQRSPYAETEPDLLFVRKFVLEHALKAFKDATTADEPLDMKYSRLLGISDIFSKMVSQRSDGQMLSPNAELTPPLKQMAKIMYEKNFITVLTAALADIDLHFPNAKRVVKYILKPLKWLTSVAVDLSTHYDSSSAPGSLDEYEISSASDDDDLIDTTREETPDLFRNSTLSMFEPTHESEDENEDDEDDEEMYDDGFADEMEYEDEMDDEDVVSEEDEEMGDMGPIEGLPGEVEVVIEDDVDDMHSDDDDDSDEDEDDEDEEEDEEDDEDDDMDDMDALDELEEMENMEEVTGEDENGSLLDENEDGWSGDEDDYGESGGMDPANLPGGIGFVLDDNQDRDRMLRNMEIDQLEQLRNQMNAGDMDDFLEEEMQDEGEEEDEEDYDEDDLVYHPGLEDDEEGLADLGWQWDPHSMPGGVPSRHTHRLSPWMFPGGPGDRILVPAFRSHTRPGMSGVRNANDGVNPLLQRAGRSSRGLDASLPFLRNEGSDWVYSLGGRGARNPLADTSPVSFISQLLNAMNSGAGGAHLTHGPFQISINNLVPGLPPPFDPSFRREPSRLRETTSPRPVREDPQSAVAFQKHFTSVRWQEEARILYGNSALDKSQRLINSILKLLVPPAIAAAKKRQAEKEAEVARRIQEEKERKEQKEREEREEREAREAKEREEREQREREAEERAAGQQAEGAQETPTADEPQSMEGVEEAQPSAEPPAEAGSSEAVSHIVTIGGQEIDIGALGIDMEYLEALPEELRHEVLVQQITEQRQRNQDSQSEAAPSNLDPEFLQALPPDLRAEVLQQHAQESRRREREEARRRSQAAGAPRAAEDMDNASFFASLDPQLRQGILMEQDETVLNHLPPELAAEARAYGGDRRLNQLSDFPGDRRLGDRRGQHDDQFHKRKSRPCVQMLDKSGVATLLRLMFMQQQGSAKACLSHILRNICENRQNRAEVISILLTILQDGSGDSNAVQRSFSQLSYRAKHAQSGNDKTPKSARKSNSTSVTPDITPLLLVQQCLQTLAHLTDKNSAVWYFFLTEHETAVGLKNRSNRKGKGKDNKAVKYPLNALLGLLDRKLIVESSAVMEQLTTLLRIITVPLQTLKKAKESPETPEAPSSAAEPSSNDSRPEPTAEGPSVSEDDTEMQTAPADNREEAGEARDGDATKADKKQTDEEKSKKHRVLAPPEVPEDNLRLVARILAARECNSKVFQETLSIINNLSPIPGAKEVFGKELLGIAQDLAQATLADLANLTVQVSKAESSTDVQGMALSKFSPASSDQTKLLRALKALDYLFNPTSEHKGQDDKASTENMEPSQKQDMLITLYESPTLAGLWEKLSECLTVIRQRGNMLNIATILLPLIEALMVVCKNTTQKEAPLSKLAPKEFALASPQPENKMESLFFRFTENHRKILNDLVRQTPKLMSGTFSLLVRNSKVLEFDNKRNYFKRELHNRTNMNERQAQPHLQLSVRREQVFLDSYKTLHYRSPDEMKYGKLNIRFHGEEGVDAGGVTREWFQAIARQMFNPDYALFIPVASDKTTFHPNRLSSVNQEHLHFFKFIGRIIGKALYEGRVLDCYFSRAVYKRILGKPVNLKDMETLDLEYYNSLQWMLNNDITDIITETFSIDVEAFGVTETVDLIENGRNIPVTEENKHEYVRLVTEHRLTGAVHEQLEHFLKGFHDIVPAELVAIFNEQELELLISGLPEINVDDWKNNTEYHNYTAASPQIQWFWRAVRSFDGEERAKLLQFVTGTSKVPLNGFKELEGMNGFSKFNIHRDYGSKDRLPSSHTCFNRKCDS
jgi:E3 ubiquitin-protein ligase HUWE1